MTTALVTYKRGAYVDKWGHKHPTILVKRKVTKKKARRRKKSKASKSRQWYAPKVHSGWEKGMPAKERRKLTLKAHKGNLLSAGRGKQALANVTQSASTKEVALEDARYFFKLHKGSKEEK